MDIDRTLPKSFKEVLKHVALLLASFRLSFMSELDCTNKCNKQRVF